MDDAAIRTSLEASFPGARFAASPMGEGKVRVNDRIDIDPTSLRRMPPRFRELLLEATASGDARGMAELGKSGTLRLRFEADAAAGESFLTEVAENCPEPLRQALARLYEPEPGKRAPVGDQFRAYDIRNKYPPAGPNAEQKDLNRRGLEFALRMGSTSLPEVVDYFDFYESRMKDDLDAAIRENALKQGADKLPEKTLKKRVRAAQSRAHTGPDGAMPDAEFDRLKQDFAAFVAAVDTTGVGAGPTPCAQDPLDFAANEAAIRSVAAGLKFARKTTAAYHTCKHHGELHASEKREDPDRTREENMVLAYHEGARRTVARSGRTSSKIAQAGGETHNFVGPACTAIVWLNGGRTGLATYFRL